MNHETEKFPPVLTWDRALEALAAGRRVRVLRAEAHPNGWSAGQYLEQVDGELVKHYQDGTEARGYVTPIWLEEGQWEVCEEPGPPQGLSWPQAEAALYRGDRVRMVDWPKGDYVQRVEPGELVFVYGDGTPTWNGWLAADAQKVGRNWELAPEPAEPPRMGWSTAEQAIVRGYRVRRASWPEGDMAYAVSPPGNMVLADSDGGVHDWAPSDEAKAARDWEYVEAHVPEAEEPTVPAGELVPVGCNEPRPSLTVPESELEAMHDRVLAEAEKGKEANARIEELEAKVANLKKQVVEGYDALGKEVKRREELEVERDDLRSNWHASIEEANGLRADLGAARTRIEGLKEKLRYERKERAEELDRLKKDLVEVEKQRDEWMCRTRGLRKEHVALVNEGNQERADYGSRIEKLEEERDRLKKDLATAQRDYEVQNEFREGAERERDEWKDAYEEQKGLLVSRREELDRVREERDRARRESFALDSPLHDQYHRMRHAIIASVHVLAMDGFEGERAADTVSHILREACASGTVKEQEEGR